MKQEEKDVNLIINPAQTDETTVEETPAPALQQEDEAVPAQDDDDSEQSEQPQPTIEDIIRKEVHEGETGSPKNFSLSKVLGGTLVATLFLRQVKLVILIAVFLIIYITCRYQCQKQMVEIDQLERTLISVRYKATVYNSILTEKSRESNILEMLSQRGDSTLLIPTEPPYKINIPEQ